MFVRERTNWPNHTCVYVDNSTVGVCIFNSHPVRPNNSRPIPIVSKYTCQSQYRTEHTYSLTDTIVILFAHMHTGFYAHKTALFTQNLSTQPSTSLKRHYRVMCQHRVSIFKHPSATGGNDDEPTGREIHPLRVCKWQQSPLFIRTINEPKPRHCAE